ncbi:hypothetical protein H8F21_16220 [Pseudomonas sp. P66]|uniref:Uncharacterized protein n=1 Tax=Pseudomonas arcuscaelestis TaxID=2710591 RepID=A0ABS2C071_9PSED|nr:hypothetical protein [Pseudomonas arcuscaelestis]MBM5459115.1 hypothetical protein [Pseudomonas arcuscaelestis]
MQHAIRKSNAGLVLWGDIYELKALWTFIHRVIDESALLKIEDPLLSGLAYEVRHAHDGMRHRDTRTWYGDDPTPIYGFDCIWPNILMQMGLLRAGLAFMSTVTRNDQAVMYQLEHTVLDGLGAMLSGSSEHIYQSALMVAQGGGNSVNEKIHSRTSYFLTLTPAKRKKELGAILDTLCQFNSLNNPLRSMVFEPFTEWSEYPHFKW